MVCQLQRLFCICLSSLLFISAVNAQNPQKKAPLPIERPDAEKKSADDEEILRVETRLVTVPVSVRDKSDRFIPSLTRENFRLTEDGIEQEITFFEGNDAPFTVVLLLDISDSTKADFANIQQSAVAFLDQLRPRDKIVLIAFNKYVYQRTEPTGDRELLKKEISEMQQGGGTSIYDALELTCEKLAVIPGRKAVVLFSDGVDTTSRATYEATLKQARELDALIYTIQYETLRAATKDTQAKNPNDSPLRIVTAKGEDLKTAYARATVYLKFLADSSSGRYFLADSPEKLSKTFQSIADELRQQYSLGFYPANDFADGKARKIKVTVNAPNAVVKARKSYVYKSADK